MFLSYYFMDPTCLFTEEGERYSNFLLSIFEITEPKFKKNRKKCYNYQHFRKKLYCPKRIKTIT